MELDHDPDVLIGTTYEYKVQEIMSKFTRVIFMDHTLETMRKMLWRAFLEHKREGVKRCVPRMRLDGPGCVIEVVEGSRDEY